MSTLRSHLSRSFVVRSCLATGFLLMSAYLGFASFSSGAARIFTQYGLDESSLPAAEKAIHYASFDPEAHYARAVVLRDREQFALSANELEIAVRLRPADHYLWMELGRAREDAGDTTGAEAALRQSVILAPYYAQPHWQLGNLLLRSGATDDGFTELRLAASSDQNLFPALTDLAWSFHEGDVPSVIKTTLPQTNTSTLQLAEFLIGHGKQDEGLALLRGIAGQTQSEVESLVARLFQQKDFVSAKQVWLLLDSSQVNKGKEIDSFVDGSFEETDLAGGVGFSWRVPTTPPANVRSSLDINGAQSGHRCFHLQFSGESPASAALFFQYLVVKPLTKYRLTFAARSHDLVTAGLPMVVLVDDANPAVALAKSEAISRGSSDWQEYHVDFETSANLQAIRIIVRRQECADKLCPIFGDTWFDSFTLETRRG